MLLFFVMSKLFSFSNCEVVDFCSQPNPYPKKAIKANTSTQADDRAKGRGLLPLIERVLRISWFKIPIMKYFP